MGGVRPEPPVTIPLYARILDSAWHDLPAEIRTMHDVRETAIATGRARVERGPGWLARLVAAAIGFPSAGDDVPVSVRFDAVDGGETWTRTFGGKSFHSRQFAGSGRLDGLLCERFGVLTFAAALVPGDRRLSLVLCHWQAFGIPLPMFLCPRSTARAFPCQDKCPKARPAGRRRPPSRTPSSQPTSCDYSGFFA